MKQAPDFSENQTGTAPRRRLSLAQQRGFPALILRLPAIGQPFFELMWGFHDPRRRLYDPLGLDFPSLPERGNQPQSEVREHNRTKLELQALTHEEFAALLKLVPTEMATTAALVVFPTPDVALSVLSARAATIQGLDRPADPALAAGHAIDGANPP
ncbi:MAG TPA: hypothetical protein VGL24_14215 [Chthoniobacterales bacterium]